MSAPSPPDDAGPATAAAAGATDGTPAGGPSRRPWAGAGSLRGTALGLLERYAILVAWGAFIVYFGIAADAFLTTSNFQVIFSSQSALVIVTLGLVIGLAVGEFDLSVGFMLGFASILTAYLNVIEGIPIGLAILLVLLMAVAFGLLNALLVVVVGVPSIVATLGTGTLLVGVAGGWTGEQTVTGVSQSLVDAMRTEVLGLQVSFFYALGLCAVVWYVLQHTPLGRYFRFTAQGREVARLAGVRVNAIRAGALVATSVFAAVAGIVLTGTLGAANPADVGLQFLLPAFAGAFLGQTAIRPGEFNAWGSWVSVYFLVTGITGLQLLGYVGWVEDVFYGASLVLAVTISRLAITSRARSGGLAG